MNDIIKTLQFEKEQLEAKNRLLQEKIESDNRRISEYDAELRQVKRLLKAAVEDMTGMQFGEECKVCSKNLLPNECPIHNNVFCEFEKDFKWRYADEALALIGEEGGNNA